MRPGDDAPNGDRRVVVVHWLGAVAVVSPLASIYVDTCEPLRRTLTALTARQEPRMVLDLGRVAVCDSSGLHLLVQTHLAATSGGGWLRLVGAGPLVRRALAATNLNRLLPVFDSTADAVGDGPVRRDR